MTAKIEVASGYTRLGFTLVEVSLAISIGLAIMAASVYAYRQVMEASKFSQAKTMVGTIQTNIGMEKFRAGTPPPLSPAPGSSPAPSAAVPASLLTNTDSLGKAYYANSAVGNVLPVDPVMGLNTVTAYNSAASPTPLVAGAPTPQWDNPIFASPGTGRGGWLYDASTGAFRINLSNQAYPDQRPATW